MAYKLLTLFTLAIAASSVRADVLDIGLGISDVPSMDEYGSANNFVFSFDLGRIFDGAYRDYRLTALGWDVKLTSYGTSRLSEITCGLENSDTSDGVYLRPGASDNFSGGPKSYSSGGLVDLVGPGLDVALIEDNVLVVDFFEQVDDSPGGMDGIWMNGSELHLQFNANPVPEPASMTILALTLGAIAVRRIAR